MLSACLIAKDHDAAQKSVKQNARQRATENANKNPPLATEYADKKNARTDLEHARRNAEISIYIYFISLLGNVFYIVADVKPLKFGEVHAEPFDCAF